MRFAVLAAVAAISMGLAGCGQRVGFDEAAVEVVEVGQGAGVQEQEVQTGRYWAPPFSYRYIVKFPTTIQTYKWTGNNCFHFINKDRVSTWQCLSMNVKINPSDADNIVRKYKGAISKNGGEDGYVLDDVVNGPITRELQQAFVAAGVGFTSAQLYADGGVSLLNEVRAKTAPKFNGDGILIIDLLSAGPPQFPDEIVAAIQAGQLAVETARKKDAELAATIAEGKKTVAEAQADAEARRLAAESIRSNPEILKLEELKVHKGICPLNARVCVVGSGASSIISGGDQ